MKTTKKRHNLIIAGVLTVGVLLIAVLVLSFYGKRQEELSQEKLNQEELNQEEQQASVPGYTLKEAYAIAAKEALKWSEDAVAFAISSMGQEEAEDPENGKEGKRSSWSFWFEGKEKERQYGIRVVNGEPAPLGEAPAPGLRPIDMEKITMDSSAAYHIAKEHEMTDGQDWVLNYHYDLQYTYLSYDDETPTLTFTVSGTTESGEEAKVVLDPNNGKVLLTSEEYGERLPSREEIIEKYGIYRAAAENLVDPEGLVDNFIEGFYSRRFSPYANLERYSREEWEELMTERYGDEWKNW